MSVHTRALMAAAGAGGGGAALENAEPLVLNIRSTPSQSNGSWEMGYRFTPNVDMWAVGGRINVAAMEDQGYERALNLWRASTTALLTTAQAMPIGDTWSEPVAFPDAVLLETGVEYRISVSLGVRYLSLSMSWFDFHPDITPQGGCYHGDPGTFPNSVAASAIYGFADLHVVMA